MKKGFTLIELLVVIIILAIIALIVTPIILDVVDDARISVGRTEATTIYKGITQYCATMQLKKVSPAGLEEDDIDCSDKTTFTEEEVSKMVDLGNAKVDKITYSNNEITELEVTSNGHKYTLCPNGTFAMDNEECSNNDEDDSSDGEDGSSGGDGGTIEPNIPESVSFAEDSWKTIAAIVKAGKAEETYNVGDTKEVTLSGKWKGTYTVRIANNSTPAKCATEGFSQTACGFVVEFVDIITKHVMKSSNTNSGGWPASSMYNFVNTNIYGTLPVDLQNVIITTYTVSGHGSGSSKNFVSNDKLYLLSTKEIWGKSATTNTIDYDSSDAETRQLDYYKNKKVTTKSYSGAIKYYNGNAINWWLRSASSDFRYYFYHVRNSGDWYNYNPNNSYGVSPAFRIG